MNILLDSKENLDEAAEQLNRAIQQAACNATPSEQMVDEPKYCPKLKLGEKLKKKKLRKRWQITHATSDKTNLNRSIIQLKKMI